MANYNPAYPTGVSIDSGIKEFITTFYGVSDTPGKNQEWVDFFLDDATLVMEKKQATGKKSNTPYQDNKRIATFLLIYKKGELTAC